MILYNVLHCRVSFLLCVQASAVSTGQMESGGGRNKRGYWACFVGLVVVSEWFMLMSIRDHYIIDLNTGLMMAQFLHRYGEKTCYFYDVCIVGLP